MICLFSLISWNLNTGVTLNRICPQLRVFDIHAGKNIQNPEVTKEDSSNYLFSEPKFVPD